MASTSTSASTSASKPVPPTGVHLVGSVPLASTEEVLEKLTQALPGRLHTMPDGETGSRGNFVGWQRDVFPEAIRHTTTTATGQVPAADGSLPPPLLECRLDDLGALGYCKVAGESFATFHRLKEKGTLPRHVRFQVSLPTPVNAIFNCVHPQYQRRVLALYHTRLSEEIAQLQTAIGETDLAIQLDLAIDIGFLEAERRGGRRAGLERFSDPPIEKGASMKEYTLDTVTALAKAIKPNVSLGFHLCYGDERHHHFYEPETLDLLVDLGNAIVQRLEPIHPVAWLHMPCPKGRTDTDYYEPLKRLHIGNTKLFLGLVHAHDKPGTITRIQVAQSIYNGPIGLATECGLGRTPISDLESIFAISKELSLPYES